MKPRLAAIPAIRSLFLPAILLLAAQPAGAQQSKGKIILDPDPPPAQPTPPPPAKPAPPPPKADPNKPAKKPDEMGSVTGIPIQRGTGYMGIRIIEGSGFQLTFYDEKKKPMKPDVVRAAVRWNVPYRPLPERAVLNPGPDEYSLFSTAPIRPPHTFKLFLTLIKTESDNSPTEAFTIDFRQ